jgi:hypothetical protein
MKPRCRGEGRLAPGLQVCGLRVDYTSLRGRFPPRIRAGRLRCRSTSRNRRGGRVTTSRCEWVPVSCGKWASHVESDAAAFGNFVDYAWTTARSRREMPTAAVSRRGRNQKRHARGGLKGRPPARAAALLRATTAPCNGWPPTPTVHSTTPPPPRWATGARCPHEVVRQAER